MDVSDGDAAVDDVDEGEEQDGSIVIVEHELVMPRDDSNL